MCWVSQASLTTVKVIKFPSCARCTIQGHHIRVYVIAYYWDSLLVRALGSWLKGCEFESWQEHFLLQSQLCVLTLIRCPFHPCVTAAACKRPQSFCQKCRWQITPKHAYTFDPTKLEWADYAAMQAWCGNISGNELTRTLSGNIRPQLSWLAQPLWTDPGIQSGISVHELLSTENFSKKHRRGMNGWTFSQNPCKQGKKPPPPPRYTKEKKTGLWTFLIYVTTFFA